jgi:hypothetical protein
MQNQLAGTFALDRPIEFARLAKQLGALPTALRLLVLNMITKSCAGHRALDR